MASIDPHTMTIRYHPRSGGDMTDTWCVFNTHTNIVLYVPTSLRGVPFRLLVEPLTKNSRKDLVDA